MSTFEINGTVSSATPATSKAGKNYLTFRLTDDQSIFDLSLFGQSMSFASKLKVGSKVAVKGMLTSREYQGKHYPNFQVQWVDSISDAAAIVGGTPKPAASDEFDSLPF